MLNSEMSRAKLFTLSVLGGIVIAVVLTAVALSVENEIVTGVLLWQDTVFVYLTGPGPPLGHDAQGNQMYEGTPIHMLILPVGFLLSIPIYSAVSYFILRRMLRRRGDQREDAL